MPSLAATLLKGRFEQPQGNIDCFEHPLYVRNIALSEFYESTIVEAKATFSFSDFECDPSEITKSLGITPDRVMRKGEKWIAVSGQTMVRPFNSWSIKSRSTSKDVNVHLRELLERLDGLENRTKNEWGKARFGITWKNNYLYAGTGPFFEADVLRGIVRWNAELYQDIYYIEQDISETSGGDGLRRLSKEELSGLFKNDD